MDESVLRDRLTDLTSSLQPTEASRSRLQRAITSRRRRRHALGACVVALGACGTVVGVGMLGAQGNGSMREQVQPASTTSRSNSTPSTQINWQISIHSYERKLMAEAALHSNYVGAEVRFADRAVIIFGNGEPAPRVRNLLANPPAGSVARWVSVPYSRANLERAAQQLARDLPHVVSVSFGETHYTSLVVGVDPLPSTNAGLKELRRKASAITDIPVVFHDSKPADIGAPPTAH